MTGTYSSSISFSSSNNEDQAIGRVIDYKPGGHKWPAYEAAPDQSGYVQQSQVRPVLSPFASAAAEAKGLWLVNAEMLSEAKHDKLEADLR